MKPSDLVFGAKAATPEENEQLLELSGEQPVVGTSSRPSDLFMNKLPEPVIEDLAPDIGGVAQQIKAESIRESGLDKGTVQGAYMKNLLGGSVEEFDELKPAPLMSEEDKKGFMFSLDRLWRTAKNPYDIVKGTAEFVSAIPGFVAGLGTGMVNIPLEVGRKIAKDEAFTIEDLYNAAAGPFSEVMELWHQGVTGPLGKLLEAPRLGGHLLAEKLTGAEPKEYEKGDPELVGEMFMAPYTAVSGPLHMLAESETYKDYPNARGVIKFAADALGLITMGRVIKGGKEEFVAKAEPIIHKATEIDKAQKDLSQIPDSVFKEAQQKILDTQKQQLELEAKAIEESLDYPKMIKEDLQAKRKTIDQIKKKDVTKNVDEAIDTAYNKATEQSIIERHFGKKDEILKEAEKRRKKEVRKKIERTEEVPKLTQKEFKGTHLSSNIDSLKEGFEQRDLGISIARDISEEVSSPTIKDAKGVRGRAHVTVSGKGLDYKDKKTKDYIDELYKEAEAQSDKPYDIYVLDKLRSSSVDWVENFNGIGSSSELHVLNAKAIKIDKIGPKRPSELVEAKIEQPKPSLTLESITDYYQQQGYSKKDARDLAKFDLDAQLHEMFTAHTGKEVTPENYGEMLEYWKRAAEELEAPKEIDYQLGERKPVELEQENHPLRETDAELVNARAKVFDEKIKGVMEDPELFTGKLVNDVNRWLNGDESVPIEQVRNGLRELAVRADELRYDFFAGAEDYPSNFINWKELVTEASEWAGKADRQKIKRTGESGVSLYSGIPIHLLAKELKRLHPAVFPKVIQKTMAVIANKLKVTEVLDIFGGVGNIGKMKDYGFKGVIKANEIEPKWGGKDTVKLQKERGVDISTIGDSRKLDIPSESVQAIFTSPTYGNLMGLKSPSKKDSYQTFAGGKISEANTGGEVWGPRYEQLHREIYDEAYRVVKPGGFFVLNMKDKPVGAKDAKNNWIPKKGSTVEVRDGVMKATDWHISALEYAGFELIDRITVKEPRRITPTQKRSKTVGYEDIVILGKSASSNVSRSLTKPTSVGDVTLGEIEIMSNLVDKPLVLKREWNDLQQYLYDKHGLRGNSIVNITINEVRNLLSKPESEKLLIPLVEKIKSKRTEPSVQLNMMIPLDEIPGIVKDWFKKSKKLVKDIVTANEEVGFIEDGDVYALKRKDVYRNKDLLEKTGFWLDKEGHWRYELGPEDVKVEISNWFKNPYDISGSASGPLRRVVRSDKLYNALPKLKDSTIVFDKTLTSAGRYNPDTNTLMIKDINNIDTIRHELQHAIERNANTGMIGSSQRTELGKQYDKFFDEIIKNAKSEELVYKAYEIKGETNRKLADGRIVDADSVIVEMERAAKSISHDELYKVAEAADNVFREHAFDLYMKDKGEMLARLASYRDNMLASERAKIPPWESLDRMLYYEGVGKEHGTTLFDITQVPAEAGKLIKGMTKEAVKAVREFRKTEDLKKFDLGYAAKQLKIDTVRGLIDQSEPLLKQVRKLYPKEAQKIIDRQRSVVAGKGYGRIQYDLLDKEVYGGRSKAQVEAINMYILAKRFNDIYGYKAGSKYKHMPAYGPNQMSNLSAIIEMAKDLPSGVWKAAKTSMSEAKEIFGNLTPKEIAEVIDSGNRYFEWMRKVIDDVVEAGLKTPEEGELLKAHDFRKFKTLKVEQLYDFNYNVKLRGETIRSTYSGVEPLGRGSLKIIDTDPRPVTSEMFARIYGAIANQAAKKEWKALAERHPENGIVSEKNISGWSPMPYMEGGKRRNLYFNPTATKYLITQSHDLSHRVTKVIRALMLAPVTRALAVGTSPAWATFVGLPMDVTHSIFTAKVFDSATGKPKKLYSPFLPHATMQIGLDLVRTLPDVYTRGEFFKDYMKHGGVMPFLTMRENRYMRGVRPPGDWAKFIDLISYHGASMETWVRAATADRAIRRVAKREGISYEEARKNKDVMYEAVHAARDRMDYNQGGWFVKALDQLGFIFLNAGMLGTRTFWRSAKENPVDFTLKTAQIGVTAASIATVGWMLYPHVMKDIPEEGNEKNLIIPLFPDHISAIDENGDEVYFYAKLRLDPGAAFMYKVFDGLTRTYLYDQGLIDQEPDYRKLVGNLKTIGPYGLSLPPSAQMASEYWSNYSWWKDRRVYTDMGGRTLDWPKSRKEGIYDEEGIARDPRLSQLSVDVSKVTGFSPVRGQDAIGNVIPRNNEFVMMMSGAYEWAFSDVPKELKSQHWMITLAEMPLVNRIIGVTRPGYSIRQAGVEPVEEARLESVVRNGKMDFLAENYYWKGYGSEQEIDEYIDSFENEPHVMEALENKREFVDGVKDLPNRSAWVSMFHTTPEAKAKHFFELYGPMSSESDRLLDSLMDAKYLSNDGYGRFMDEMDRLSREITIQGKKQTIEKVR